ncbi:putative P450 monooxygenase [Xylariales sp. PMI_506]|nr:putative P450 monooxygenase [Xylariales sp. PMI_506]
MAIITKLKTDLNQYAAFRNVFVGIALGILVLLLRVRLRKGLRDIPGPLWASVTPFDRIMTAASGTQHLVHRDYHRKYGSIVRVGPGHVSIADAQYIPVLYGITSKFVKSDFYSLFDVMTPSGPVPTVFSIRDPVGHSALKKPVAHAFAMTSLLDLEPMVDQCTRILEEKLDRMQKAPIDLGTWMQWYAFDVISSITFSDRFDFMKNETDVAGIIKAIEGRLYYNSVVGMIPFLHKFPLGNNRFAEYAVVIPAIRRLGSGRYIADFARQQMSRYHAMDKSRIGFRDMLSQFKTTRDGRPTGLSDLEVHSHVSIVISYFRFAGSDTTAISLRSLFYYLSRNPRCMRKVVEELDDATQRGDLSELVTFAEGNKLRYFQACLKEALRMHPAVGFLLERIVPEGGAVFGDAILPAGTVVGINPWVLAYDETVYGKDAGEYRPERWLEADSSAYKLMDRSYFAFGAGTRTCLGKNVSLMEMSKLVLQLLRDYSFELADPKFEWQLHDFWFVRQSNVMFTVRRRVKS